MLPAEEISRHQRTEDISVAGKTVTRLRKSADKGTEGT